MMNSKPRILGLFLLSALALPAHAQEPTLPKVDKIDVPRLKRGPLPPPPTRIPKDALKDLGKNKKDPKKPDSIGPLAQRKPPAKSTRPSAGTRGGAADTKSDDADKPVPKWQQPPEKKEDAKPTLSADFIKNCARLRPGVKVHLDIYDEELEAVVKLIACMTGKNIVLAKSLKSKKITIYSPALVTANEAYDVFLYALLANGFSVVKKGRFIRIEAANEIVKHPGEVRTGGMPPNEARVVTQIVSLDHVDAQEISEVISKFATSYANIVVYAPMNALIITESAENLRKLLKMIRRFDAPGGRDQLWTYQVIHADAAEIAAKIQEVYEKEGKATTKPKRTTRTSKRKGKATASKTESSAVGESELDVSVTKVISDERTNRLLIVATARSYRRIKSLIAKLDVEIPGDGQVHIHQLNHAKAADLATVLSNLSQEAKNRASNSGNRRTTSKRATSKGKGAAGSALGASSAALFEGEVSVTADEDTNALVVTASLKDFHALKKVIDVLDRPRRQVFIEAVIMEVLITNSRDLGIALHGGTTYEVDGEELPLVFGNTASAGGNTFNSFNIANAVSLTGLAAATQGPSLGVEVAGNELPSFGVIVNALSRSADTNILSTPHILTTDNEEAEIVVGSNVPFVAGGVNPAAFGGGANLGALGAFPGAGFNIQRQDVALTLKITPRINAANFVTMEIDQVIEEIESNDPQLGPRTSKRSIKSTVVVGDQRTVVIGGLQKSKAINGRSGVPILGEIPVIGYFFRSSNKERERLNLLVMLTPYVIEGPEDFRAIYDRKREEHREFVARFHKEGDQLKLGIDYGKKNGVVQAINRSLREAREEQRLIDELRRQDQGPPLPQDLDGIPVDPPRGLPEERAEIDEDAEPVSPVSPGPGVGDVREDDPAPAPGDE